MMHSTKPLLIAGMLCSALSVFSQNYNLELRSTMTFPGQTLANICGYTQDGREYALLGGSQGLIIVEVTNPGNPQQIVQIPGPDNLWKEIKVYGHYAYVTSEGGQGLQIVDLSPLPSATLPYHFYTGNGAIAGQVDAVHALHIDVKKGFLYLYGGQGATFSGGAKVLNLNPDPYNPTYVGKFDQLGYIHDGFAENDTLYAAHINAGIMSIVDMSNKSNPVLLGTIETPSKFTHNTWLLDDHKHILTTDEKFASFVTSYDISNPEDIRELDRISTTVNGSNSIGHNTHVLNDWAITSWYTDGVTIVDAHRPDILVEVARYDTWASPVNLQDPFDGCWGAYPYFPSGTIVTSDINPGKLTVLTPTYKRACYLEGTVLNGCDNNPMFGASITINAPDPRVNTTSNLLGIFKTGYLTPGNYTATISKPGFASQTIPFQFETAQTTILNVVLEPLDVVSRSGSVINALTGAPVPNATVTVYSSTQTFYAQTDASGNFVVNCIANDAYTATAGTWGYLPLSLAFNGSSPLTLPLQPGYYDDFELDYGWESTGTAPGVGHWVLGEPEGTYTNQGTTTVNPEFDMNTDNNDQCYMTGNGGGQPGSNDVDEGNVVLTTPPMVLGQYQSAKLSFYYWFFNYFPQNQPANDKFIVNAISNGQTVNLLTQNVSASQWRFSGEIPLENYITLSDEVRIEFITADDNPGHWVEAAIDIFNVEPSNPFSGVQNNLNANALIEAIPNPSGYDFGIQYDWGKSEEELVFEVRNMVGQVVYQTPLSNSVGRINCGNNFTSGVYFAILRSGTQSSAVKKLIKG